MESRVLREWGPEPSHNPVYLFAGFLLGFIAGVLMGAVLLRTVPLTQSTCEQIGAKLAACDKKRGKAHAEVMDCRARLDRAKAREMRWREQGGCGCVGAGEE